MLCKAGFNWRFTGLCKYHKCSDFIYIYHLLSPMKFYVGFRLEGFRLLGLIDQSLRGGGGFRL